MRSLNLGLSMQKPFLCEFFFFSATKLIVWVQRENVVLILKPYGLRKFKCSCESACTCVCK